jgi:hypothetical protein
MAKLLMVLFLPFLIFSGKINTAPPYLPAPTTAQAKPVLLTWDMLFKVILIEKYSSRYKSKINVPDFDPSLWKLNGKTVYISGFAIPTTTYGTDFVLSQNPYSACYFCGNGGVETVMTLKFKKKHRYKTDDYITVKGKLLLNDKNIEELIYVLQDAEEYNP